MDISTDFEQAKHDAPNGLAHDEAANGNGRCTSPGVGRAEKRRDERDGITPKLLAFIAKKYGLAETAARLMQLREVTPEEALQLVGVARRGILIPYFDLDSKLNGKFRIRFYDDDPEGSNEFKAAEKPLRYMSPAGVAPGIYLYPGIDWRSVAITTGVLYTTEGEFSAAKACSMGLHFIGLSGVWSYKSKNARAFELLPEFDEFTIRGREIVIVYDSDLTSKSQVLAAQHAYAAELAKRGAKPKSIILPTLPGQAKTGIDEFLNARSVDEFKALPVQDFDEIAQLFKLSSEYVYDRGVHAVLRLGDYSLCFESDFCRDERNRRMFIPRANGKGVLDLCAPVEWLKWANRPDVSALVYEPALPTGRLTDGRFNLHRQSVEPKEEPKEGERLHLWHRLIRELVPDEQRRAWLESWLFYPIQNPGTKLYTMALLWSRMEGTGKSFVGELISRMYGINAYELNNPERLFEAFNSWGERRRFVLVNEIHSGDSRKRINRLKNLATSETIEINIKNKPHYSIKDTINYLLTSNHEDALYMTDVSRRFAVFHVSETRLDKKFTDELHAWKLSTAGSELLWYAQRYPILDSFEPHSPAPYTQDNADMVEESRSSLDQYCCQILSTEKVDEETCRKTDWNSRPWVYAWHDLWTGQDIAENYNLENHGERANRVSAGRAMSKAGAALLGRVSVKGRVERIMAIRDFERYRQIYREAPARIAEIYLARFRDGKLGGGVRPACEHAACEKQREAATAPLGLDVCIYK